MPECVHHVDVITDHCPTCANKQISDQRQRIAKLENEVRHSTKRKLFEALQTKEGWASMLTEDGKDGIIYVRRVYRALGEALFDLVSKQEK